MVALVRISLGELHMCRLFSLLIELIFVSFTSIGDLLCSKSVMIMQPVLCFFDNTTYRLGFRATVEPNHTSSLTAFLT